MSNSNYKGGFSLRWLRDKEIEIVNVIYFFIKFGFKWNREGMVRDRSLRENFCFLKVWVIWLYLYFLFFEDKDEWERIVGEVRSLIKLEGMEYKDVG